MGNAFSYAWKKFTENLLPLVLITLLLVIASAVIQGISIPFRPSATVNSDGTISGGGFFGIAMIVSLFFGALSYAVTLIVQSGIVKGALNLTRGEGIDVGKAFQGIDFAQVIVTAILTAIGVFVGLVLCILPGIIFAFLTSFALYFVVDRNMQAIDAIKASIALVRDNVGSLLLFFLASFAAYIVGACLCGVGLLAAIPVVVIAQAYTFRTLTGDTVLV